MNLSQRLVAATLTLAIGPLATAAACPKEPEPNPLPTLTTPVAQVCLGNEDPARIRQDDDRCSDSPNQFHWVYVTNAPNALPLPAVGQALGAGRGTTDVPTGVVIGSVPSEGVRFTQEGK